jgi:hypothetical protein
MPKVNLSDVAHRISNRGGRVSTRPKTNIADIYPVIRGVGKYERSYQTEIDMDLLGARIKTILSCKPNTDLDDTREFRIMRSYYQCRLVRELLIYGMRVTIAGHNEEPTDENIDLFRKLMKKYEYQRYTV